MSEYTFDNVIINPFKEGIESLIGKEVYFHNNPSFCLMKANEGSFTMSGILSEIRKDSANPFCIKCNNNTYEYPCIIVKKEPCYEDQVKQWIEENNLKVGDYVKVNRRAENHADGLDDYWYDLMRDSVGKILKVKEISNFITLDNGINYPYFVLEKIEPPKPKCVPFENVDEFLTAFSNIVTRDLDGVHRYLNTHGIWLKEKGTDSDTFCMVIEFRKDGVCLTVGYEAAHTKFTPWSKLCQGYTFLDGSPCGKIVKEDKCQ